MIGQSIQIADWLTVGDEGDFVVLWDKTTDPIQRIPLDNGQLKDLFRIVKNWGYMADPGPMTQAALFAGGEDLPLVARASYPVCADCGGEFRDIENEPHIEIDGILLCPGCYRK